MDSGVIIAIIFGVSSIISSICFGIVPTIRKEKLSKLETKNQRLLLDVKLFHEIEDELLRRLEHHGYNYKKTKEDVRKVVSNSNGGKVISNNAKPSSYKKILK